jgi:hypothetical protein
VEKPKSQGIGFHSASVKQEALQDALKATREFIGNKSPEQVIEEIRHHINQTIKKSGSHG